MIQAGLIIIWSFGAVSTATISICLVTQQFGSGFGFKPSPDV